MAGRRFSFSVRGNFKSHSKNDKDAAALYKFSSSQAIGENRTVKILFKVRGIRF